MILKSSVAAVTSALMLTASAALAQSLATCSDGWASWAHDIAPDASSGGLQADSCWQGGMHDANDGAGAINVYNLVVFETLTSNSEVEGSAFVGGDLIGSSANFCIKCGADSVFKALENVGLTVVGNITGNPKNINNRTDLVYGGRLEAMVNLNGGGQRQSNELSSELTQLRRFYETVSQRLARLEANSTVEIPSQQPGAVRFNASGERVAVFEIEASQLFSQRTQQIELNLNGSETVVINVSGRSATWTQGNMVGGLVEDRIQQKVVWNFYEAEELRFNNGFHGSLLAPKAALTNQTEIEGSVVVRHFDQQGEVHLPVFGGRFTDLF